MAPTFPGSRDFVKQAFVNKGVPLASVDIMLASITESTLKQYNVGFKLWWQFCQSKNTNPFNGSIADLLEFFTFHFEQGKSFGTLNSIRAAISLISSSNNLEDFRLKRFFKGIQNLRPNRPKYDTIWDPSIVLKYLESLFPNEGLSLRDITLKLASLLALVTAHRVQTLSLIRLENIVHLQNGIEIKIPDRIKTSGRGSKQPLLTLPKFTQNPKLCVASTLDCYLKITKAFRGDVARLFITFKKPFRAATSQSISRWIKLVLARSGLNTSIFTAHSTRHAATSAAYRSGVNLDVIRRTAGWSVDSQTFAVFYNKPIVKSGNVFADSILSL